LLIVLKYLKEMSEKPSVEIASKMAKLNSNSKSNQKIFLQFIHLVQNSNGLNVPILGDINMELFTNVMNGAYSYLMCLLNFTKIQ
jgi:hypothetical protein